jgi:hypothetical protein
MRLPFVSLACVAGAVVQLFLNAPAHAQSCCGLPDEVKTPIFDETKSSVAEEMKPVVVVETNPEDAPPPVISALPAPTPLDLTAVKLADKESYADVFRVLKDDNTCSRFFGGPNRAVAVFNQLALQLRSRPLGMASKSIAILMSGSYTMYRDASTGASYRLFDEATINSNGPFAFRVQLRWSEQRMIGRFPAQTRQARALVLLHELGHLMEGASGSWLLPNDGKDFALSERNTRTVESRCAKQLLALED